MTSNQTSAAIAHLLQGMGAHDGQLLDHFLTARDEPAFEELVRRHGAMVVGVCRRILGNAADADDAFQATFLVLLRRAASLTGRAFLGDFLHGVARRTALYARRAAGQRRAKEQAMARSETRAEEVRNDWLPLLDEELDHLPEKYRLPIVLCDLEGRTRQEAARQLEWPEGTVAGRLARGRELLARRLLRKAQMLSGAVPGILAGSALKAAAPSELMVSTVQAAALVAAGKVTAQGVLTAEALSLANKVVRAMLVSKGKIAVTTLLLGVLCAFGLGASGFGQQKNPLVHQAEETMKHQETDPPPNLLVPREEEKKAVPQDQPKDAQPAKALTYLKAYPFQVGAQARTTSFSREGEPTQSAAFSPDGKRMVFLECKQVERVGYVFTLHLQETATRKEIRQFAFQENGPIGIVGFSPDGKILAASRGEIIRLWEVDTGKEIRSFSIQKKSVFLPTLSSFAFSPDGKTLAAVSLDLGQVSPGDIDVSRISPQFHLWDAATGKELRHSRGDKGTSYRLVGFSRDGKVLAWVVKELQSLESLVDLKASKVLFPLAQHQTNVRWAVLSPDGNTCVWGSTEYGVWNIHQWDLAREKEIRGLKGHNGSVTALVFSPDGKTFASAGGNGTIKLWETATGKELQLLEKQEHNVTTLAFAPDGKTLASGGLEGWVFLWRTADGKMLDHLPKHKGWITSVGFSPDGKMLVGAATSVNQAGQGEEEAFLWDLTQRSKDDR